MWKFAAAPLIGFVIVKFVVWFINKVTPQETGYYHVIMICTAMFTYGIAEILQTSGILAVFTAGFIMGNKVFVHKQGVYNFSSAISTICNILLFIMLGILVEPGSWFTEGLIIKGLILFAILSFVARPLVVFIGTIGMKIKIKDKIFISWAGLRGAVPIVLATYPSVYGIENGKEIFNLVFFAVILSLMIQGSMLGKIAKILKISTPIHPEPPYSLELFTKNDMEEGEKIDVFTLQLKGSEGEKGPAIRDLKLPESALILMIARRKKLFLKNSKIINFIKRRIIGNEKYHYIWQVLPPRGDTILHGWDQITFLSKVEDEEKVIQILMDAFSDETPAG